MSQPDPPVPVTLRLLGLAAWRVGAGAWQPLSRKDAALLARLALQGPQSRSAMAAWLWPGVPLPRAHANLRQRLFRQRRHAAALVEEEGAGLRLRGHVQCDVHGADDTDAASLATPLLAGLPDAEDEVQHWLDQARQQWAARRLDLLAGRAAQQQGRGELAAALASTEALLALDPLLEHGWRRLMRLHHARGDRAAAVAAFERCERVLRDELSLKPAPETVALLAEVEALAGTAPPPRWPLPPSLLRPPRLVARQADLTRLSAAWQAGQSFVVVGEPGLGKSRLLAEFAALRPAVLLVAARPGDESVPYGALLRLLRRMALAASDTQALWPAGASRNELARLLPELGPAPQAPGLQGLLRAALDELFDRAPGVGIEGVLFDDLQHADAASRHALLHAAAATAALRWGFASRAVQAPPAWPDRAQVLTLRPLGARDVAHLLATLDLPGLDRQTLAPRLASHCGGNPLFVLETLKHLLLEPAAAAQARLPLPASVHSIMAERLARLSAPALALARLAAVAGADFHPEIAADVLATPIMGLADAWQELLAAQVLHDNGFAHESLLDAVLQGLPQALQRPLHERVAHSLRQRGAPAAALARHFAAAGLWAAAADSAVQAAADARRLGRNAEQLAHLHEAAAAHDAAGQAAAAFAARVAALAPRLAAQGLQATLDEAAALQPQAGSPAQRVALHLARAEAAVGDYRAEVVLPAAAAALAEAVPGSHEELRARLLQAAGQALHGHGAEAVQALEGLRPRIHSAADPLQAATLWSHCALVEHAAGRMAACVQALQQQLRLAQAAGDAAVEVQARSSLSALHTTAGDAAKGIAQAQEAGALHRRMGEPHAALLADANLAIGLIGCDRLGPALQVLQAAAPALRSAGDLERIAQELQAEVWLRVGRPGPALRLLGPPPPAHTPLVRQLNWRLLQATAVQLQGDGRHATLLWHELRARLPPGQSAGVRLRAAVLSSVVLPAQEARAELSKWVAVAEQAGMPAGAGQARLRRAAFAWRSGDLPEALADVRWLLAQRARLQHLYLPTAELLALACAVLDEAAQTAPARAEAAALRAEARAWFVTQVQPELPRGCEASWCAHPAHRGLFGGAACDAGVPDGPRFSAATPPGADVG